MPAGVCVYVLADRDGSALKIGWAVNANHRATVVAKNHDPVRSYQLTGFDRKGAMAAERALHLMFRAYRVERPTGEGRTEWFDGSTYDALRAFVEVNRPLLGYGSIEPVAGLSCGPRGRSGQLPTEPAGLAPHAGWLATGEVATRSGVAGAERRMILTRLGMALRKWCQAAGVAVTRSWIQVPNRYSYRFPPDLADAWLDAGGRADLARWVSEAK